jgi:hypothetical protein
MKLFRIIRAALREIFDESAYERFCRRQQLSPCEESYARFLQEGNTASNRRIKCC